MTANSALAVEYLLRDWGSPQPDHRARQILDTIRDLGWREPVDPTPPPLAGASSTEAGRRKARELYEATRREKESY